MHVRPWHRILILALWLGAVVALVAAGSLTSRAWAQEATPAAADAAAAPATDAVAPVVPAVELAVAAAAPGAPVVPTKTEESMLMWLIETSGLIGLVILLLSIYFVYIVVRAFLDLRAEQESTPMVIQACDNLLKARDLAGMYKLVKEDDSYVSNVLAASLKELQFGLDDAREAADRVSESHTGRMEAKISMLAVLGSLGPMIGLLGTLQGMIGAFSVIARSDTQIKSSEVAGEISRALVLTFEGVALSVPAIFFFSFFRTWVFSVADHGLMEIHDLLRRIHSAVKTKAPAPPAE